MGAEIERRYRRKRYRNYCVVHAGMEYKAFLMKDLLIWEYSPCGYGYPVSKNQMSL